MNRESTKMVGTLIGVFGLSFLAGACAACAVVSYRFFVQLLGG